MLVNHTICLNDVGGQGYDFVETCVYMYMYSIDISITMYSMLEVSNNTIHIAREYLLGTSIYEVKYS